MTILPRCPFELKRVLWPEVVFYDKQVEIIKSVEENDWTVVPAGHQLGKDFVTGFIVLSYFLRHWPCRVVTTSVKDDHLRVLWGEMGRFVQTSRIPLDARRGGPLVLNHREVKRKFDDGAVCPVSYLIGAVSERGEGMAGHHAPWTLFVGDEACHDDRTEVLTNGGWKYFKDLTGDETYLTMDPVTRVATYLPATHVHKSFRDGPMVSYERRGGNFCVTPNHKMLWSKYRGGCDPCWGPYELRPVNDNDSVNKRVPRNFVWEGASPETMTLPGTRPDRKYYQPLTVDTGDWVEFLGWYMSEGSLSFVDGVPYGVHVSQNPGGTMDRIVALVKRLGFRPKVYGKELRFSDRRLAEYLLAHGRYCHEKRPPSFVGGLSPDLITRFLDAYKEGDGYDRGSGRGVIYTSSKAMADDLQVLAYKSGRQSTVLPRDMIGRPAPNGVTRRLAYVVGMTERGQDHHLRLRREHLRTVDYKGYVYCVTVPPHHTIFTRRDGVCMWGGNSGIDDETTERIDSWAKRRLLIGNPYECQNLFRRLVDAGDQQRVLL